MKASTQTFLAVGLLVAALTGYILYELSRPASEPMEPFSKTTSTATSRATEPAVDPWALGERAEASEAWAQVWKHLRTLHPFGGYLPQAVGEAGPPVLDESRVLFRFDAPPGTQAVYLAGNFNDWAQNSNGRVENPRFAMEAGPSGRWFALLDRPAEALHYRYVVEDAGGEQRWVADPQVRARDRDGNSVVENPLRRSAPAGTAAAPPTGDSPTALPEIRLRAQQVRAKPGEAQEISAIFPELGELESTELRIRVLSPLGRVLHEARWSGVSLEETYRIPGLREEGGYLVRLELLSAGEVVAAGQAVVSIVEDLSDDLRYGFYATYEERGGDYEAKARMLAESHINAVEFYDYFPAHGKYAPTDAAYTFEPFGTRINALDVQKKIEAGHQFEVLSLAYVAAYAASPKIYRQYPYPMTNQFGEPKVFNGSIMTEAEAEARDLPKWFWLMDVSQGSPWYDYIMREFARTLDDSEDDLVSFDGFEIDTYGDEPGARFYAQGSSRSGDLLSDVLRDFVRRVRALTQTIKPEGMVSFNSVNEFGVDQMYEATDFLFLEIWRDYTDRLSELVDICFHHRGVAQQRVVLKLYPVDMDPSYERWPADVLARVLGATMTGGGSLMVAGEPDEAAGELHALRSLYYPDHLPMLPETEAVLQRYYRHDALLYGYTHGKSVLNTRVNSKVPGCLLRAYAAPEKQALTVQLLNLQGEPRWSKRPQAANPLREVPFRIDLPASVAPRSLWFVSPDSQEFVDPIELDFDLADGSLTSLIPFVQFHATLILQY